MVGQPFLAFDKNERSIKIGFLVKWVEKMVVRVDKKKLCKPLSVLVWLVSDEAAAFEAVEARKTIEIEIQNIWNKIISVFGFSPDQ